MLRKKIRETILLTITWTNCNKPSLNVLYNENFITLKKIEKAKTALEDVNRLD